MKYFFFFTIACAFFSGINAYKPRGNNEIVERVRTIIQKIFSEIPDPWQIPSTNITIPSNNFINGEFDIIKAQFSGISKFQIDTLNYDVSKSRFDFAVNLTNIMAEIATSLDVTGFVNINEHQLGIKSTTSNFGLRGHVTMTAKHDEVTDFSILVSIGQMTFDITGFMNNPVLSQFISTYLTENAAEIINSVATMCSPFISSAIQHVVNFALRIIQ